MNKINDTYPLLRKEKHVFLQQKRINKIDLGSMAWNINFYKKGKCFGVCLSSVYLMTLSHFYFFKALVIFDPSSTQSYFQSLETNKSLENKIDHIYHMYLSIIYHKYMIYITHFDHIHSSSFLIQTLLPTHPMKSIFRY